jgi:hypothetical protein
VFYSTFYGWERLGPAGPVCIVILRTYRTRTDSNAPPETRRCRLNPALAPLPRGRRANVPPPLRPQGRSRPLTASTPPARTRVAATPSPLSKSACTPPPHRRSHPSTPPTPAAPSTPQSRVARFLRLRRQRSPCARQILPPPWTPTPPTPCCFFNSAATDGPRSRRMCFLLFPSVEVS